MSPLIQMVLTSLRTALEGRFEGRVRRVCLFGSWARGEATEDSDVDVAVVIDGLLPDEWSEAIRMASEVEVESGLPISPFIVSSERFDFLRRSGGIGAEIDRDGISA